MKKYLLLLMVFLTGSFLGTAQEYKIKRNTGRLKLNLSAVTVIGYDGNEIVIKKEGKPKNEEIKLNIGAVTVMGNDGNEIVIKEEGKPKNEQTDARAKGLKRIGASGYEISPGLGITVVEREGVVEIDQLDWVKKIEIVIMVPKSMSVSLSNNNSLATGLIKFSNINGEIEINAPYNRIELEGVTGPLTVSTIAEPIKISFASNIKEPVSINSISGRVEVWIAENTPVNLNLSTTSGKIIIDDKLLSTFVNSEKDEHHKSDEHDEHCVKGKYKGGGAEIRVCTVSSRIYIKSKLK